MKISTLLLKPYLAQLESQFRDLDLELNQRPSEETSHLKAFIGREMKSLGGFSLTLPFRMVTELASFPEISHVSSNEVVSASGHVTDTTGASAGQAAASTSGRGMIDGSGISIAILDSGIDINHAQFSSAAGGSRVLASVDFTGENRTDDPYGHGTFVAGAVFVAADVPDRSFVTMKGGEMHVRENHTAVLGMDTRKKYKI